MQARAISRWHTLWAGAQRLCALARTWIAHSMSFQECTHRSKAKEGTHATPSALHTLCSVRFLACAPYSCLLTPSQQQVVVGRCEKEGHARAGQSRFPTLAYPPLGSSGWWESGLDTASQKLGHTFAGSRWRLHLDTGGWDQPTHLRQWKRPGREVMARARMAWPSLRFFAQRQQGWRRAQSVSRLTQHAPTRLQAHPTCTNASPGSPNMHQRPIAMCCTKAPSSVWKHHGTASSVWKHHDTASSVWKHHGDASPHLTPPRSTSTPQGRTAPMWAFCAPACAFVDLMWA